MSLPRSYTLPREYKYYRRNKTRKLIKNEHFIISTNSSDGMTNFVAMMSDTKTNTHIHSLFQVMLIAVTTMNRKSNQINRQIERPTIHKDAHQMYEKIISNIRRPHRRH